MSPQCKNNQFGRFSVFICIFGRSGLIFGCSGFGRWGGYFRTFGVRGPFSDVRGSDVGGGIFGRSGFGANFRSFKFGRSGLNPECPKMMNLQIRTFGVEPRMSENFNAQNRTFGVFIIGRSGFNPEHKNPQCSKTPNVRFRTFGVEPPT